MKVKLILTSIIVLLVCVDYVQPQSWKKEKCYPSKMTVSANTSAKLNINNISTHVYNNGITDETSTGDQGCVYPIGSGKTIYYLSGLLWGGSIDDVWAVGGSDRRTGLTPGRILPEGTAEDITLPHIRIYRVRSDYKNFTTTEEKNILFASEIADETKTAEEIYAQYDLDWNQWPAQYGAPYIDLDGNGIYNPNIDVPGMSMDPCQTVWYVANDLDASKTQYLYGALPMKIEMQATFWAYKANKPIGNTIFRKYKIINRNSKTIDQMYFSLYSDPDLGYPFDDLAGCDTTLNLGYVYNGKISDEVYGTTPPSTGFSILQGPVIPGSLSDSAKLNNKWVRGKKNLGMTSFFLHSCGADGNWSDPIIGNYNNGALKWKNVFEGKLTRDGIPYTNPVTGRPTKFPMSGDPVSNTGWLDGTFMSCGDRYMGSVTGPFTMNAGDTQEVVFAQIAAGGTPGVDRLGAVSLLKYYTKSIKALYDNTPILPSPPPAPQVTVSELNNEIVLSWLERNAYTQTENFNKAGMKFEGYNIYQLSSANSTIENAVRITTYDVNNAYSSIVSPTVDENAGVIITKVVAFGTNSGIRRSISITTDKLKGNIPLYNGSRYYFAVTAYGYNPDPYAVPNVLESPLTINTCTPQGLIPGTRVAAATGDAVTAIHSAGNSLATVSVDVLDPARVTGHDYEISFGADQKWTVKDVTRGVNVLANQAVYGGIDANSNPVGNYTTNVDGLRINVNGTLYQSPHFDGIDLNGTPLPVLNDNEWVTADLKWRIISAEFFGYGGTSSYKSYGQGNGVGGQFGSELQDDLELRWTGVKGTQTIGGTAREYIVSGGSMATYYSVPEGLANFPLNPSPGTNANFLVRIPFEIWNVVTNLQITCIIRKRENAGEWQSWNATNGARMYVDVVNIPYDPALVLNEGNKATWGPKLTWWFCTYKTDWTVGDVIRIRIPDNALTAIDKFTFTSPAVTTNIDLAKEDINSINVYPNPYYCLYTQGDGNTENQITFTHLPQNARIKIFNIAGQCVRFIEKTDNSQFAKWDLKTDGNYDAPTGIYVAHIELPDLGKVKILKFAIIREQRAQVSN